MPTSMSGSSPSTCWASFATSGVTQWLLNVLANEREVNVVAAAIDVLAEVGEPEHVAALHNARQRFAQDPFIGFAADVAIARIESS